MEQVNLFNSEIDDSIENEDKGTGMKKPFNPNKIVIRPQTIPIYSIAQRIEFGEIKLNTEFQRKEGLWKDEQQSRLIESILIRFPLPVFYFDGSNPDEWLVIDGLQRLTSLKRFIVTKELKLTGLEFLKEYEGKGWDDLDRPLQRQINETPLQCYILEKGDPDVKFNIFKRINTGGLNLSDQEIRHAMHQDVAVYLQKLAESKEFLDATRRKIKSERMLDRDFINRFIAFYILDYESEYKYEEDLDTYMNKALDKLAQSSVEEKKNIENRFKKAMILSKDIFGDSAFCKSKDYKRINKALFEVVSVHFAKLNNSDQDLLRKNKTKFKSLFYKAIDNKFADSLVSNTGGRANVLLRHREFNNIINEFLG